MIIGHVSDTHLGAYAGKDREREQDYYDAFQEAVDIFIKDHVKLVIHSGDILDSSKPYGTAMKVLAEGVKRLNEKGIRFIFTLGEHDISNVPSTPHPYILDVLGIANYVGTGEPLVIGDVIMAGLHKYKKVEREELCRKIKEVANRAKQIDGKRRILVLHQGLIGLHGFAGEISKDDIPMDFDYYAMGHIHMSYDFRHGNGLGSYPGMTHWVDWDDPETSFVNLVDLSSDEPKINKVRLESVRPRMERYVKFGELETLVRELISLKHEDHKKPCLLIKVETDRPFDPKPFEDSLSVSYMVDIKQILKEVGREVLHEVPDMDAELRRLTEVALGSNEKAEFALFELLKALNDEDWRKGALEIIWKAFKEGRLR
ncbi:MAG: DNA repair exonuclease [Thaumarchaeota archaeon]|jgi:DNA repair exonuclease SbcCD nuclease subunit|nr:DNA repair exonuclease [Candidatus Terraquivivens yellowstonensis]